MNSYLYFLIGFAAIVVIKFVINWSKFLSVRRLYTKYEEYIVKPTYNFHQYKNEIIELIKGAGVRQSIIHKNEPAGFGYMKQYSFGVLDSLTENDPDVIGEMRGFFHQAIGEYKRRATDSFNPIYWIEVLIKLPEHILKNFGVLPANLTAKLGNLVWWLILVALGVLKSDAVQWLLK